MLTKETCRTGSEISVLYDRAFEAAEYAVNICAAPFDQAAVNTVFSAARRVGRIMQLEFPTVHQAPWVCTDIEITNEAGPDNQDVTPILQLAESAIWAYQPVWTVYADAVHMHTGRDIDREEIEIVALESVEHVVQWRWNPLLPSPARNLSKLIASNLKYLGQDVFRSIQPDVSIDVLRDDILPSNLLPPETYLIQKETIVEELARLHMSAGDLLTLEDQRQKIQDMPFMNKNTFPVHVHHPRAIWGLLAELTPRERLAVLHSLGYVFPGTTAGQLEKRIGLHDGHLKGILHGARQKIVSLWQTGQYETGEYSTSDIQRMIEETLNKGIEVKRLRSGAIDRSSVRQELRRVLQTLGEDGLKALPQKRARVVEALLDGYMAAEVGANLGISRKTVVNHAAKALEKLKKIEANPET